jgi:hypothetical protein
VSGGENIKYKSVRRPVMGGRETRRGDEGGRRNKREKEGGTKNGFKVT